MACNTSFYCFILSSKKCISISDKGILGIKSTDIFPILQTTNSNLKCSNARWANLKTAILPRETCLKIPKTVQRGLYYPSPLLSSPFPMPLPLKRNLRILCWLKMKCAVKRKCCYSKVVWVFFSDRARDRFKFDSWIKKNLNMPFYLTQYINTFYKKNHFDGSFAPTSNYQFFLSIKFLV